MERIAGLRFLVVGAARSGVALTRFLLDRGGEVVLTDSRSEGLPPEVAELGRRGARLELGGHDEEAFRGADRILVSPGVPLDIPPLRAARQAGVPVWGEIEFASRFLRGRILGITGTNGKSTTTTLLGRILSDAGHDAVACGNLGTPLISLVDSDTPQRLYVAELSSFQLESVERFRCDVAVLLNIAPDHQDRYPSHEAYREAKGRIFRNQGPEDRAILNRDDPGTLEFAPEVRASLALFSRSSPVEEGACVREGHLVLCHGGATRDLLPVSRIPLVGVHNLENVLAASAAADAFRVPVASLAGSIVRFRGLPHRIEPAGVVDGVRYYNDSKATNVAATARSLESFEDGVVLILGGKDKGGDFASLVPLLRSRARAVVLMGKARDAIAAQIGEPVPIAKTVTMAEAVEAARRLARPGQVVLLAPGCASFDAYRSFEERGDDFKAKVRSLTGAGTAPAGASC
jgi:UDP-N-acetylmuramoylalanine--D-glutamate ligase